MEILWWLAPAAVVTLVTMCWVGWWSRQDRASARPMDPETAARRLGEALERAERRVAKRPAPTRADVDPSSGVALRAPRDRPEPPVSTPASTPASSEPEPRARVRPPVGDVQPRRHDQDRRAS